MGNDRPTYGERLKRARTSLKLTQASLAAASGVSLATIARIERGEVEPRDLTRAALNEALQGSMEILADESVVVTGDEAPPIEQLPEPVQARTLVFAFQTVAANDPAGAALAVGSTITAGSQALRPRTARLVRDALEVLVAHESPLAAEVGVCLVVDLVPDPDAVQQLWNELWRRSGPHDRRALVGLLDGLGARYSPRGDD